VRAAMAIPETDALSGTFFLRAITGKRLSKSNTNPLPEIQGKIATHYAFPSVEN